MILTAVDESLILFRRAMKFGFLFVVWLGLAYCSAQDATPNLPKPGEVSTAFSRIYVMVDKSGAIGHKHGIEGRLKSGQMFTNGSQPGSLVFDMTTFDADGDTARKYFSLEGSTDESTRQQVNENMLSKEILNVKRYPESKLENVTFKATGRQSARQLPEYVMEGDFTLHQVTKHIAIACDVELKKGWQHVRGAFKILQSDYGIKPFSKMFGAVGVKDELVIAGDLWVAPAE